MGTATAMGSKLASMEAKDSEMGSKLASMDAKLAVQSHDLTAIKAAMSEILARLPEA